MNPVLDRLLTERQGQIDFVSQLLEKVESDGRDLVDAERSNIESAKQRIAELDAQIKPLEEWETTRSAHAETVRQTVKPTAQDNSGGKPASLGARERNQQNYETAGHFVVDYLRARGQDLPGGQRISPDHDALTRVQSALGRSLSYEEREIAHQTTVDTPGLLPRPIIGEILDQLDSDRPLIQAVGARPMGNVAGKKFARPRITQHTVSGKQSAEKTELPSRQFKVEDIEFEKSTHGGALNVSRQDIDWTSPSAWNLILSDLQAAYAEDTEEDAGRRLDAQVTQSIAVETDNMEGWIAALYQAATMSATGNGKKKARAGRLPDIIFTSVDMWASLGTMLTVHKTMNVNSGGTSTPRAFGGDILDIPRIVVPSLPEGTFVVGRKNLFEWYEERIGLLSAVEPKVLGIEIAYGGYVAGGVVDPTAFTKVTGPAAA